MSVIGGAAGGPDGVGVVDAIAATLARREGISSDGVHSVDARGRSRQCDGMTRRDAALWAVIGVLGAGVAFFAWPAVGTGDLFQFWYAGRLVITGGSPYDPAAWSAAAAYGEYARNVMSNCTPTPIDPLCVWVYPPATALLFAPFALLDVAIGTALLELVFIALGLVALLALARWMGQGSGDLRFVVVAACLVSHPFVFDLRAGHFEALGVLGLLALAYGFAHQRAAPVVVGALLLSVKPHLYLFVGLVVLIWLIRRRWWRALVLTSAALIVIQGGAALRFPDSVGAIATRSAGKVDLGWASTWALLPVVPDAPVIGLVLFFGLIAIAFLVSVRNAPAGRRADVTIAAAAAVSIAIAPYVHPYDLFVTFPTFAIAVALTRGAVRSVGALVVAVDVALVSVGTWLLILANRADLANGLPGIVAPLLTLSLMFSVVARDRSAKIM